MLIRTILNKAAEYIDENPVYTGSLIIKIQASYAEMPVEQFLSRLDVRHIGTLRALVPGAFPKKLRTGELVITRNIHGAWRVDPKETVNG